MFTFLFTAKSYYRQRIRYERRLYRDLNQIKEDYDSAGKTFIFHWRFRQSFSDKNCDASRRSNVKRNPGTYRYVLNVEIGFMQRSWENRINSLVLFISLKQGVSHGSRTGLS